MGPTSNGPFMEVVTLGSWHIVWDPNKAIDIGELSICGGGQFERFNLYYMYYDTWVHFVAVQVICNRS